MSMIPMLEFSKLPPRNEDKPKRRRKTVVKTPKFPKVRTVAILGAGEVRQRRSSRESDDQETFIPGAKWVSPQFQDNAGADGTKKMEKRQLQFGGRSHDHAPRRNQRKKALSLRNKQRENQIFIDKDVAEESCARSRGWRREPSEDVSTFLSSVAQAPSLYHTTPSVRAQVPSSDTLISHHFPSPNTGQLSLAHTPSEMAAQESYSQPAEYVGDPGSMVSPAHSESSDDSTYLEDGLDRRVTSEVATTGECNSQREEQPVREEQLVRENGMSSSTKSFRDHLSGLASSPHHPQSTDCAMEPVDSESIPDSSTQDFVEIKNGCTYTEELVGDETRLHSTQITGTDMTGRVICSNSDRLSAMVANMSVEEEYVSSSSSKHATRISATKTRETEASGANSLPNTDSIFSHPQPSDAADGQAVQQFKPSSFSTPVHRATSCSTAMSRVGEARIRLDYTSVNDEEDDVDDSVTRLEDMAESRVKHDSTNSNDKEGDDSVTRLENLLETRAATPSKSSATYLPASPPKSILKKRCRHSLEHCVDYGEDVKSTSKCVTFNLPRDCSSMSMDSDSVLVTETPLELWQSLRPTTDTSHIVAKRQAQTTEKNCILAGRQMSVDLEDGSVLAAETSVEQWQTPYMSTSMGQPASRNASHQASNVPVHHGNGDVDEECVSMLALETPVDQWQSLNPEQRLGVSGETPEDIWQALNRHKDTGNSCSVLAQGTPSQMWLSRQSADTSDLDSTRQVETVGGTYTQREGMETSAISLQQASLYPPCGDGLSGSEDLTSYRDVLTCSSRVSSSPLAPETPDTVWASLNMADLQGDKNLSSIVQCTASTCSCHKEAETISSVEALWQLTPTPSLNPMCILAMETPLHMWTSPPVKLVDNTFKQ